MPVLARRTLGLAVAVALAACAATGGDTGRPPADTALAQALQGVWCNPSEDGSGCWAYDEFRADGSFEACGRTDDDPQPFHAAGRYVVSGHRMCYVVARATANFWLPPGARYCTDIVAIDARAHRYRDIDTGRTYGLRRVPPAENRCPAPPG